MVGRSKYDIPSVEALRDHYNTNLIQKKMNLHEEVAQREGGLEGRMTVKDYKTRQEAKQAKKLDPLASYIFGFQDCAEVFNKKKLNDSDENELNMESTPFIFGKLLS